jgi:hypothetical protein
VSPAAPSANLKAVGNSDGSITVSWDPVNTAEQYTVYRSTTEGGPYNTAISTNQTNASYTDTAGSTNGDIYYYEVTATNSGTCTSGMSSAVSAMSCLPPSSLGAVSVMRTGNHRVTVSWTDVGSPIVRYDVWRSTSATGTYTNLGNVTAAPFQYQDDTAWNPTAYYYYVVAAKNSTGTCKATNTTSQASAPSCTVVSGASVPASNFNTTSEYCIVSCDTIATGSWQDGNMGTRTLYVNNVQTASGAALPALVNSGRAFYWTASSTGTSTYLNYWNATAHTCP